MQDDRARDELWKMIDKYRFAMMTTQEDGGQLRTRPMTTIERAFDGSLWFFVKADSGAAAGVANHPQVSLSYTDSQADFVSVGGSAVVVTDTVKKRELWSPAVQAWFPEGPESAQNVLVKVTPEHAEYWHSSSNKLVQLFSMAKAIANGTAPRDIGEHREVALPAGGHDVNSGR